jgi:hypothetical protein
MHRNAKNREAHNQRTHRPAEPVPVKGQDRHRAEHNRRIAIGHDERDGGRQRAGEGGESRHRREGPPAWPGDAFK